ncbi:MAG: hypothetical protein AAB131_14110 [Actinomycetota bacterium]|jgi:hypothetical protein|nr:MAG: hypothetical protein FD127_37 [Acidimicrobiaceae bacterium]
MSGAVLAHQGGWDEILLIMGPILVVVALLRLARKRVERAQADPGRPSADEGVRH